MTLRDTPRDINPVIMAGLVQKISFPTVLYGSELWTNLTMADILKTGRFILLAANVSVPACVPELCLSLLGWQPMIAYIDQRKFMFLQKLCTMSHSLLPR